MFDVKTDHIYPADIVWACAVAAARINNGYLKDSQWNVVSTGTGSELVETPSNRRKVFQFLELYRNNLLTKDSVTNEDYQEGKDLREFWQSQMLILLNDRANSYLKSCVATAHKTDIDALKDIGVIVSSITSAKQQKQLNAKKEIKSSVNSQWVHSVGSNVVFETDIAVISCRFVEKFNTYIVEAIIENNLYMWWSQKSIDVKSYSHLKGKVKQHKNDFDTDQPITQLNYVKIK